MYLYYPTWTTASPRRGLGSNLGLKHWMIAKHILDEVGCDDGPRMVCHTYLIGEIKPTRLMQQWDNISLPV